MSETQDTAAFDLGKVFQTLRAHRVAFLATVLLFLGISFGLASRRTPLYSAQAQVLVASSPAEAILDSSFQNLQIRERELANEVTLATSDAVEAAMIETFGAVPKVTVRIDVDSDVLIFNAIAEDPVDAADQANAWANDYVALKRDQSSSSINAATDVLSARLADLRERRTSISAPLDSLNERIALASLLEDRVSLESEYDRLHVSLKPELDIVDAEIQATVESISGLDLSQRLTSLGSTQVVRAATPAKDSTNTPSSVLVILGGVAGLLVGSGLVLVLANLDHRLKDADDVVAAVGVPVIASIPDYKQRTAMPSIELVVSEVPSHPVTDAYLAARSALQFSHLDRRLQTLLITSASASEGKTSTAVNLAYSFARLEKSVALVDLDLRRPRLHKVFGHDVTPGLTDAAVHDKPLSDLFHDESRDALQLRFLATGLLPASATDFLASSKFSDSIDELLGGQDTIIFDSAPVLPVPDTLVLASKVDATVIVARSGVTRRKELQTAIKLLEASGARVAGVVLVGVAAKTGYYGYESEEDLASRPDSGSLFASPPKRDAAAAFEKLGEAQQARQRSGSKARAASGAEPTKNVNAEAEARTNGPEQNDNSAHSQAAGSKRGRAAGSNTSTDGPERQKDSPNSRAKNGRNHKTNRSNKSTRNVKPPASDKAPQAVKNSSNGTNGQRKSGRRGPKTQSSSDAGQNRGRNKESQATDADKPKSAPSGQSGKRPSQ